MIRNGLSTGKHALAVVLQGCGVVLAQAMLGVRLLLAVTWVRLVGDTSDKES